MKEKSMQLKEAVLKSLEEINSPSTHRQIYYYIVDNNYYDFLNSKTPEATVSSTLGDFIRQNHPKVKRVKAKNNIFLYLLK